MKSKMVSISVRVPDWAFVALQRVAHDREWSISHLVRFLVLGSIAAWERKSWEHDDRLYSEAHEK